MKYLKLYENFTPKTDIAVDIINAHRSGEKIWNVLETIFGNLTIKFEQGMNNDFILFVDNDDNDAMMYHKEKEILFVFHKFYKEITKFSFESNKITMLLRSTMDSGYNKNVASKSILKWYIGTNYDLNISKLFGISDMLDMWNKLQQV